MESLSKLGWKVFPPHQLIIGQKDNLLVLPYSTYSFAADVSNGEVKIRDVLSSLIQVGEGLYDVYFALQIEPDQGTGNDDEENPDRLVRFTLVPTRDDRELELQGVPGMND